MSTWQGEGWGTCVGGFVSRPVSEVALSRQMCLLAERAMFTVTVTCIKLRFGALQCCTVSSRTR